MRQRSVQLGALLLATAGVAGFVFLLGFSGQSPSEPTRFVIYDDKHPGEALAVYVDSALLKKHNVSAEKFEVAFRAYLDLATEAIAWALAEMFAAEPAEGTQERRPLSTAEQRFTHSGIAPEVFREILETTRMECWTIHADGTHTVIKELSPRKNTLQTSGSASRGERPSSLALPGTEGTAGISVPPTTLEQAKKFFAKHTGIAWPDDACDVQFDEYRVPLLGDGLFYVVLTVPPDVLIAWLGAEAPWGAKEWIRGPIPAEAGCHCGFGYLSPNGWEQAEDGRKEYCGGDPEILAVLKSQNVWYVARDRGPKGNPWYNGDLLILDPKTSVIRYCSWDM